MATQDGRGEALIGAQVRKQFNGVWYEGVVESFDTSTGFYKIHYEDDDREDQDWRELKHVLVAAVPSPAQHAREAPAADRRAPRAAAAAPATAAASAPPRANGRPGRAAAAAAVARFAVADAMEDDEDDDDAFMPARKSRRASAVSKAEDDEDEGDASLSDDSEEEVPDFVSESEGEDDARTDVDSLEGASDEEAAAEAEAAEAGGGAKPAKRAKAEPRAAPAPKRATAAEKAKAKAADDADAPPPPPKPAKATKGKGKGKGATAVEAGDTEATFNNVDQALWAACDATPPSPLPAKLNVLELFAGCGGMHMQGSVTFGAAAAADAADDADADGTRLGIDTLAAVEIEEEPARTYAANHKGTNVFQMGVGRFLGTARRLQKLKDGALPRPAAVAAGRKAAGALRVVGMQINQQLAAKQGGNFGSKSTTGRQDKDHITVEAARGERPLFWLEFLVADADAAGAPTRVVADVDTPEMHDAVRAYLNDPKLFTAKHFPLPGDIQVVTGGPPCQGWSGYNTTRITASDIITLMSHKENRLLGRFLEVVWFYRPLYVVMEEVPDVGKKPQVMQWMEMVLNNKGYAMTFDKKVTTGHYGCPQTRDRLILIAAMKSLVMPAIPAKITAEHKREEDNIQRAFDESTAAYPYPMRPSPAAEAEKAAKRRADADARLAAVDAELARLAEEACGSSGSGAAAPPPAPKPPSRAASRKKAAPPSSDGAGTSADPMPEPLMRGLVLGDAISCDLPVECTRCTKDVKPAEDARHSYVCGPPTPYIAYLRQGVVPGAQSVRNHVIHDLGLSDELRMALVPFFTEACWRDMLGDKGCMHAPQMFELTEEEATRQSGITCIANRFRKMIPEYMLANPADRGKKFKGSELPALKHGWTLAPNRWPVVPYWCLTMKLGKDKACYGRLSYTEPHDTVHSYAKPHWHVSLAPFAPRVLSVREKARIQGFPDRFVFLGDTQAQYKQIANAVSPQLAIAIARSLLLAMRAAIRAEAAANDAAEAAAEDGAGSSAPPRAPPPEAACFSGELRNFADFLASLDERTLVTAQRLAPQPSTIQPKLSPCSYEECLVAYNTQARTDHSTRYKELTPFYVLNMVEENRSWQLEEFCGIRRVSGVRGAAGCEVAGKYRGFQALEWTPLSNVRTTWAYKKFLYVFGPRVEEVLSGRRPHYCRPGVDPAGVNAVSPELAAAKARFLEFEQRYAEELAKGWIVKSVQKGGRKRKADEEEYDTEADPEEGMEPEEEEAGGAGPAAAAEAEEEGPEDAAEDVAPAMEEDCGDAEPMMADEADPMD